MPTVDVLQLEIRDNSQAAVEGLQALESAMGRLQRVTRGFNLDGPGHDIQRFVNVMGALKTSVSGITHDTKGFAELGKTIEKFGSSMSKFNKGFSGINLDTFPMQFQALSEQLYDFFGVMNETGGQLGNMSGFENLRQQIGNFGTSLKEFGESFFGFNQGEFRDRMIAFAEDLYEVNGTFAQMSSDTSGMGGFRDVASGLRSVGTELERIATASRTALRDLTALMNLIRGSGSMLQRFMPQDGGNGNGSRGGSNHNLLGKFNQMGRNMLMRNVWKLYFQGISEGLKNVYEWANRTGHPFKDVMDGVNSSLTLVKNSIGAAAASLITNFAPAITFVANAATWLINKLNQLFAMLAGKDTWIEATYAVDKFGSSASSAGKKVKQLLAPFDELNIIQSQSDGNGSSQVPQNLNQMFKVSELTTEMKLLATLVGAVGAGLLAWKFPNLRKTLGFVLLINGVTKLWDTIKEIADNHDLSFENLTEFGDFLGSLSSAELIDIGESLGTIGAGIGLITGQPWLVVLSGIIGLGSAAKENWGELSDFFDKMGVKIEWVETLLGGSLLALGAILLFSGASPSMGLALLASGAITLADVVTENWDSIVTTLSSVLGDIEAIVGASLLALGAIMVLSGAGIGLGLGMIAAGAVSLVASQAEFNGWSAISSPLNKALTSMQIGIGGFLLVLGALLALSGVATPLGLAMMAAGGISLVSGIATAIDWNALWTDVKSGFTTFTDGIVKGWEKITKPIRDAIDAVKEFFSVSDVDLGTAVEAYRNNSQVPEGYYEDAWGVRLPIPGRANGGMVGDGQLFLAREAGPEFVGTMGGHTAVANNDQIVEGVASGVAAGQAEQNALLRSIYQALMNKEFTATVVPSAELGRVNARSAAMYTRMAGGR